MRIGLFLIAAAVLLSSQQSFGSPAVPKKSEVDNVENAIIIDGLSLTSSNPPADEDVKDGGIIYDDNFDDSIIEKKISKSSKPLSKEDILSELKKKDVRWHYTVYKIRKNDTLWGIAKSFGVSHRMVIRANGITGPDQIREGKEIQVPNRNGYFYTVKKGDTLDQVGITSKISAAQIKVQNPSAVKVLKAGSKIFIPDGILIPEKTGTIAKNKTPVRKNEIKKSGDSAADEADVAEVKISDRTVKNTKCVFMWPLRGKITSGFGVRSDPFSGAKRFHNGIDISAEVSTPVKAAADGEVIFSGWKDDYGNLIVLKHANGYVSVYGHNSVLKKEVGEHVTKGSIIALSGMTGLVTGAHLHFEVQKYQTPLNPLRMLK